MAVSTCRTRPRPRRPRGVRGLSTTSRSASRRSSRSSIPETLELEHRFEELYEACQEDELLARVGRRRADRHRDRDPLGPRRGLRRRRARAARAPHAPFRARRPSAGLALAATGTHPWASYLDQRIIDTEHYNRLRAELRLGRAAQQHLEPPRPRRRAGRRSRDRGLRPPARAAAAAARALGQLAVPRRPDTGLHSVRTRDLHPHLPPLRDPRAVRRLGAATPSFIERLDGDRHDRRGHPALVERSAASLVRHGRAADLRRPDPWRGFVRARRADRGLHRAVGARLRRRAAAGRRCAGREIEENLWRAIRYGMDGEMIDWRGAVRAGCPTRAAVERLLEWTAPAREAIGRRRRAAGVETAHAARARATMAARRASDSADDVPRGASAEHPCVPTRLNRRAGWVAFDGSGSRSLEHHAVRRRQQPSRGGASRADRGADQAGAGPGPAGRERRCRSST